MTHALNVMQCCRLLTLGKAMQGLLMLFLQLFHKAQFVFRLKFCNTYSHLIFQKNFVIVAAVILHLDCSKKSLKCMTQLSENHQPSGKLSPIFFFGCESDYLKILYNMEIQWDNPVNLQINSICQN